MPAPPKGHLEKFASGLIGDGEKPNIYFVSQGSKVVAIFTQRRDAIEYAASNLATAVEDRLEGVIWGE